MHLCKGSWASAEAGSACCHVEAISGLLAMQHTWTPFRFSHRQSALRAAKRRSYSAVSLGSGMCCMVSSTIFVTLGANREHPQDAFALPFPLFFTPASGRKSASSHVAEDRDTLCDQCARAVHTGFLWYTCRLTRAHAWISLYTSSFRWLHTR